MPELPDLPKTPKLSYLYSNIGLLVYEDGVLSGLSSGFTQSTKPIKISTYSTPQEAKLKYYTNKMNELISNKDKLQKKLDKIEKDINKLDLEYMMCLGDDIDLML